MYEQKKHVRLRNLVLLAEASRFFKVFICYAKVALGYKKQIMAGVRRYRVCKTVVTVALPHSSPPGPRRPVTATRSDSFIVNVTKWSKS